MQAATDTDTDFGDLPDPLARYDSLTFRAWAETAPAGMCILSGDEFRIKWCNAAFRLFQEEAFRHRDLRGMLIADLAPGYVASGAVDIFRQVAGTRVPFVAAEYEYRGYSRGVTYWHSSLTAMPAPANDVPDLMMQAIDITDSVRTRKALEADAFRHSQRRRVFDTILSGTLDFNFVFDLAGKFTYVNQAFADRFVRSADSMHGQNFYQIGLPQDAATTLQQQIRKVIRTGQREKAEVSFLVPAGQHGYYKFVFMPVTDAYGKVEAVTGSARDITESKRAEEALRASEELYRFVTEFAPQVVWMADAGGHVTYLNQRWFDLTGLTAAQSEGMGWLDAVHPDHRAVCRDEWLGAIRDGREYVVELPLRNADGDCVWHASYARPVRGESGQVMEWVGIAVDIDRRKQHRPMQAA